MFLLPLPPPEERVFHEEAEIFGSFPPCSTETTVTPCKQLSKLAQMQVNVTDCAVTVISLCRLQSSALGKALREVSVLCVRLKSI